MADRRVNSPVRPQAGSFGRAVDEERQPLISDGVRRMSVGEQWSSMGSGGIVGGSNNSINSVGSGRRRSQTTRTAGALGGPFPAQTLVAFDVVVLFLIFVLAGLFAEAPGTFESHIVGSLLHVFEWRATVADVVVLSATRAAAVWIYAGVGVRRWPAIRRVRGLRLLLFAAMGATVGLEVAKFVCMWQAPDKMRVAVPLPLAGAIIVASAAFGCIETIILMASLRAWVEQVERDALASGADAARGGRVGAGGSRQSSPATASPGAVSLGVSDEELDAQERPRRIHWMKLGDLIAPDIHMMACGILMLVINSIASLVTPVYFGRLVDAIGSTDNPLASIREIMIELIVVLIVTGISGFARSLAFTLMAYRIVKRLRSAVFRTISVQDIAYFDVVPTGELISRLASDSQVLQSALTTNLSMFLRFFAQAAGAATVLLTLSWKLSLIMFSCVPVIAIGAAAYGKYIRDVQEKFQDKLAEAQSVAQEVISQIRTVRAFAKEEHAQQLYEAQILETHKVGTQISIVQALFMGLTGFLPQLALSLVMYSGTLMVLNGEISVGLLTSFLIYTLTLAMAFGILSNIFGDFMEAIGASQRIFELMDRVPTIPVTGGATLPNFSGRIELRNIEFSYPARQDFKVLDGVSLTLEPGTVLALVGPSGQGKSTIMSLLLRLYDVDRGSIILDDRLNLKVVNPAWYRKEIGYVSQEPVLFSGTIAENIRYGWRRVDREPTHQEIVKAAMLSNAHLFIESFPLGYEQEVGERGVQLSGGQKQRIAIARAFLMDPKILLLDEATSALDAESEHLVQDAIDRVMQGRTVVVIAHRLSTVINATKIAVIQDGKVAEQGTHSELMSGSVGKGVYRNLVIRQMKGGPDKAALIGGNANQVSNVGMQTSPVIVMPNNGAGASVSSTPMVPGIMGLSISSAAAAIFANNNIATTTTATTNNNNSGGPQAGSTSSHTSFPPLEDASNPIRALSPTSSPNTQQQPALQEPPANTTNPLGFAFQIFKRN